MAEGTRQARRDDIRSRILDVARELFATDGFDATSVKQIAKRVGLSDAALYYHFKNKREILNAVWDVPMGRGVAAFKAERELTGERLDEIADSVVEFSVRNEHLLKLMCLEILRGDQTALALRQQNRAMLRRTLFEHFATLTEEADAEERTDATMAVVTGATMKLQMETGPGFRNAANSPEFRERVRRWARRVGGLELASA